VAKNWQLMTRNKTRHINEVNSSKIHVHAEGEKPPYLSQTPKSITSPKNSQRDTKSDEVSQQL